MRRIRIRFLHPCYAKTSCFINPLLTGGYLFMSHYLCHMLLLTETGRKAKTLTSEEKCLKLWCSGFRLQRQRFESRPADLCGASSLSWFPGVFVQLQTFSKTSAWSKKVPGWRGSREHRGVLCCLFNRIKRPSLAHADYICNHCAA